MEEGDVPYETLDSFVSMSTHMVAGAAAGITEHVLMYPLDCVKTRMQCLVPDPKADYRNLYDAFRTIIKTEGIKMTGRGLPAMAVGAGPAHAMYFSVYEEVKLVLAPGGEYNMLAHGCAGCTATLFHDAVMVPADAVKQRMQFYGSPYKSTPHCIAETFRKEGLIAFYRSYPTQLSMSIVFQLTTVITYEFVKEELNPKHKYDPVTHIIAGGIAGAAAACVTMPLDVCKTLINLQEHCTRTQSTKIRGMVSAVQTVYQIGGFAGFFKGLSARILYQAPATGISWGVYEFFKYIIHEKKRVRSSSNRPDDR